MTRLVIAVIPVALGTGYAVNASLITAPAGNYRPVILISRVRRLITGR